MSKTRHISERKVLLPKPVLTIKQKAQVKKDRTEILDIIDGMDDRMIIIVGPCSAWPEKAVIEYAEKLSLLCGDMQDKIKLVMRVYTQKPRTTVGWKGPLFEPDPCKNTSLQHGVTYVQKILSKIVSIGLPVADEALFLSVSAYLEDYWSYAALGARSSEDQEHRSFGATRGYAIGVKNTTSGDIITAVNSVLSTRSPGSFYFDNVVTGSDGNIGAHLVLRGGKKPNYTERYINMAINEIKIQKINPVIIVDTNHSNSQKEYKKQIYIIKYLIRLRGKNKKFKEAFKGFMIESFLQEGNQDVVCGKIDYDGLSITDPCLSWEDTEGILRWIYSNI